MIFLKKSDSIPIKARLSDIKLIVILCLVVSVGRFSLDSYLPSLPAITALFRITPGQAELSLTYYFFGYGISQFIYGPLSEKYGRRNVLLIGMFIFLFGSFLCATALSIKTLILGRCFAGIGAGSGGVLARAIVCDWFPDKSVARAWAQITTAIVISLIVGPIIGAFIQQHLGFRYNFWLSLLYGTFVFIVLLCTMPETHLESHRKILSKKIIFSSYISILRDNIFLVYIACSTLAFSTLVIYFQLSPFIFMTEFGYHPISYSLVLIWVAFSYVIGGQIIKRYSNNIDSKNMITYGAMLILLAAIILILWSSINLTHMAIVVLVATLMFVVGARLIIPTGLSSGLKLYRNIAGYASAISGGMQMLGSTIVSYSVASFLQGTPLSRLSISLLLISLIIAGLLFYVKNHSES